VCCVVQWDFSDVPEPQRSFETSGTTLTTIASYRRGLDCLDINNKYSDT
jgi:hypothetical protein